MARDMAIELQPHNVASITLWQGLTLTEKASDNIAKMGDKMTKSITNMIGASVEHPGRVRSEEHTSELQSLMRISYAVFCLKKKNNQRKNPPNNNLLHKTSQTEPTTDADKLKTNSITDKTRPQNK